MTRIILSEINGLFRKTFEHAPIMVGAQVPSPCTLYPCLNPDSNPTWIVVAGFSTLVLSICLSASLTRLMTQAVNRRWGFELHVHHQMGLVGIATQHQAHMMLAGFTREVKSTKYETYRMYTSIKWSIKVEFPVQLLSKKALPSPVSVTCKQPSGWVVLCFMPLGALMTHLAASEQLFFMWKLFSSHAYPFLLSLNLLTLPLSFSYCPPLHYRPIFVPHPVLYVSSLSKKKKKILPSRLHYALSLELWKSCVSYMEGVLLLATNRCEKEVTSFHLSLRMSK